MVVEKMDWHAIPAGQWLDAGASHEVFAGISRFLHEQGTFEFPSLPNGLFPAASGMGEEFEVTGYRNIWVRDNVQVAFAHFQLGKIDPAVKCMKALLGFFQKHRHRFEQVVDGVSEWQDPMKRPHIRFNGESLEELPEKWAHAQNDALGYFLWFYAVLVDAGAMPVWAIDWELLALMMRYFEVIRYWEDEDSGHWEESRKVSASSMGIVCEAIRKWIDLIDRTIPEGIMRLNQAQYAISIEEVRSLYRKGNDELARILPAECIQEDATKYRRHDAALVFLCYPINGVSRDLSECILDEVAEHLMGDHGVRRYRGDSYWCADYKDLFSPDQRSVDFSDNLESRDRLLKPGTEAQWCIFDPAMSCAYGVHVASDLRRGQGWNERAWGKQLKHLKRSLSQLTHRDHSKGPYRCPESRYLHKGEWTPNDITPLLWTQANLMQALWWAENNAKLFAGLGREPVSMTNS